MNDSATQISDKSEDRSQQARIPAPVTETIDANHCGNAKKIAHVPPVCLESHQAALQLDSPGNDDLNPMAYGEDEDVQNLSHMPPEPPGSCDRANPGAFRVGGEDDDDGNAVTYGEAVWSHGVTTDAFHVNARLVEEDPEEMIAVAVVPKKRFIYISMGVLGVLFVVVVIVLAVTLSTRSPQSGTTPTPTPAPSASASGGTRNLFTTLAGSHRYFGHMFDITAKADLRVVSMDIHTNSTAEEIIGK